MSTDQRSTAMAGVSSGQQAREQELVNRVLASFAHAGDAPERAAAGFERCQRVRLLFIAGPARNAVPPVAGGKSGRLREAYLYVWV